MRTFTLSFLASLFLLVHSFALVDGGGAHPIDTKKTDKAAAIPILSILLSPPSIAQVSPVSFLAEGVQERWQAPSNAFAPPRAAPSDIADSVLYEMKTWSEGGYDTSRVLYSYSFDVTRSTIEAIAQRRLLSAWLNGSREVMVDSVGLSVEHARYEWDGRSWTNRQRELHTYTADGGPEMDMTQMGNGTAWLNETLTTHSYDKDARETEEVQYEWIENDWAIYGRFQFSYDSTGNRTETIWQIWRDSSWVNISRRSYTFDGDNRLTLELLEGWSETTWTSEVRYLHSYEPDGDWQEIYQDWDGTTWINFLRYLHEFDSIGRMSAVVVHYWASDDWQNSSRDLYTYDGNGSLVEHLYQIGNGDSWVDAHRDIHTYDVNGRETSSLSQAWDVAWKDRRHILYTWGLTATSVQEGPLPPGRPLLSANYPNPFNPSTTIEYTLPHAGYVTLRVYNVLGEEVAMLVNGQHDAGTYTATWDASSMPSGVYFYRLTAGEYVQSRKMVLAK